MSEHLRAIIQSPLHPDEYPKPETELEEVHREVKSILEGPSAPKKTQTLEEKVAQDLNDHETERQEQAEATFRRAP